jgi:hypothetical protein
MIGTLLVVALLAQAPVIDNQRVRVYHNQPVPAGNLDAVRVTVDGAAASAAFIPRGAAKPAQPATLTIELKDAAIPPFTNTTQYPNAFPRPGIKKLLENDRVIVWDYAWTLNSPTGMHNHDKDVVVMFLEDGDLVSTTPDGTKTVNQYKPGTIRFNARDRVHFETLTRGNQRAIIVELK